MKKIIKRVRFVLVNVFACLSDYLEFFDILKRILIDGKTKLSLKIELIEVQFVHKHIELIDRKVQLSDKKVELMDKKIQLSDEKFQLMEKEIEHLKSKSRNFPVFLFCSIVILKIIEKYF